MHSNCSLIRHPNESRPKTKTLDGKQLCAENKRKRISCGAVNRPARVHRIDLQRLANSKMCERESALQYAPVCNNLHIHLTRKECPARYPCSTQCHKDREQRKGVPGGSVSGGVHLPLRQAGKGY